MAVEVLIMDYLEFQKARLLAGLSISETRKILDISERTLFRWRESGRVPAAAGTLIEILAGDLEIYGWRGWKIERGRLYCDQLNPAYHSWSPGELLATIYKTYPSGIAAYTSSDLAANTARQAGKSENRVD